MKHLKKWLYIAFGAILILKGAAGLFGIIMSVFSSSLDANTLGKFTTFLLVSILLVVVGYKSINKGMLSSRTD